jgi:Cu+-exporting ATPase
MRRVVLPVSGMHCASCVSKVEKALGALAGVSDVSVDLPSRTVAVSFEPSVILDTKALRRAIEKAGYDVLGETESRAAAETLGLMAQQREQARMMRHLQVAVIFSVPLLLSKTLNLSPYTSLLLALPIQFYGASHFHEGLYRSIARRSADMNTLVSLSTWAAFVYSCAVVMFPERLPTEARQPQWDAVSGLVVLVTLGRWLEAQTRGKTSEAVAKLMRIAPKTARVVKDGREKTVQLADVQVGDVVRVRPGEQVALDGVVLTGQTLVDESLLTGESMPVEKAEGSRVWGGTINKNGAVDVRVARPGSESALARIVEAVRESQATKPKIQKIVDRVAAYFVPAVVILSSLTAVLWAVYGPEPKVLLAMTTLVSMFAVACPCALGLATPLAIIAGVGHAAELGVFIRNADVLEEAGRLDVLIFDKTGTLTEGRPRVGRVVVLKGTEDELLRLAATVEQRSEHPFAAAVLAQAKARGITPEPIGFFEAFPGRGVLARAGGRTLRAGSLNWLRSEGCSVPASAGSGLRAHESLLAVAEDDALVGFVVLSDALRSSAKAAVRQLTELGIEVVLASGDRNEAAYSIAEQAGIGRVFAEVVPEEKARIVSRLQAEGKRVAMVGEGFNDAPALAQADIGIALASGTDIAVEAADMTVMHHDLTALSSAIRLSQLIRRVIRQNLAWAFVYNLILLPVAAGALYPKFGILLRPHWAGAAMALSSISVAVNSLRLRRGGFKL